MSTYGLKYSQYLEQGGVRLQIKVYVKDYSGASYGMAHITGASLQIVGGQSDVLSPVLKTAFSWSMADCWDEGTTRADGTTCVDATGQKCGKWEEFYTNDATKFKVELSVLPDGGTAAVIWTGFVTQDSWSESLVYRGSVTITARDMLGALQDKEFNLTGRVSILDIVQGALSACACPMALSYTAGHFLVNSNGSDILAHTVAASTFSGDNWQTVLEDVLESLGLVLRYNGANGIVLTSYRYIKADTLLGTHGCEFISLSGLRSLNPALKEITETFDVDVVEVSTPDPSAGQFAETGSNLTQKIVAHLPGGGTQTSTNYIPGYTLALSGDEGWAGSLGVPAIGTPKDGAPDRGIYFPTDIEEAAEASLTLPRMRGYFAFKIEQDGGLVEIAGQAGALVIRPCTSGHSVSEVRVRVEAFVDGVTKYLTASGSWDTESTDFGVAIGQEIIVPDSGAVGAKVVIVKVITENTMPAYFAILAALRVAISPGADGASIISEYKTTTIYNEENNVTISRSPKIGSAGIGGCVDFYENVLSLGDSVAPDEWNWGGESSYYPLAVMIHAQILVYNAAAASVFTGTMHDTTAGHAAALPGYGINYYQRDCVPVNATYDFASGFVGQTTLREVYTWAQVWGSSFNPQYTRKSGSGKGSTSATGAGGASVTPGQDSGAHTGAGGVNYFEPDAGFPGVVTLKGQYDGLRVPAIRFGAGADSFDLYVDTVQDSGGNPVRVLRTPLAFISDGDQIIGDGTPGSGGGGGGASCIYELKDTLSSWIGRPSVSETQVLVFDPSSNVHDKNGNNGAWKYVNASSIGGVTSVVGQTGTVTVSQIASALTGAGYKLTDTVITDYWKTGDTRTKNTVLAAPNGSNGAATFRALVPADIPSLAISKITNLQTSLDAKQDTISDLDTIRSNASTGVAAYNALGNYVLKSGDTMTGDLIISKTGGGNLIIRGTEANHDGGTLYFYGRYYSGNPRNGAKIAAVYPGSGAYDIQDLVFYSSDNRSGDASPIWQEAMRIKSTKAVSVATSLAVGTTLSVSGLATLSGGASIPVNKKLTIGDAEIEWIPNSGNGYLRINKPLLTVGDQIVNSGTPGGGGGGGGAGFLYELGDVLTDSDHTVVKQYNGTDNAANNNLFAFNGSKWYALKLGSNLAISSGTLNATNTTYSNGTGLALSNGVFSITSAYQTNIANGASAYSTLTTSQTKNKVLASPSSASGAPSFRALVAADLPSIENLTNFSTKVYDASASRTANYVLAAPNGSNGAATFRKLVAADIPSLTVSKITDLSISSGTLTVGSTTITPVTDVAVGSGTYADNLAITKGGSASYITVPFATTTRRLKLYSGTAESGGYDLNTLLDGGGITRNYSSTSYWANGPSGMSFGSVAEVYSGGPLSAQFAWDINHNSATPTRRIWWRANSSTHGWQADWHLVYDSSNANLSTVDWTTKALSVNGTSSFASGHLYLTGAQSSSSTANTTQIVFGTSSNNHVAISSDTNSIIINPSTSATTNQIVLGVDNVNSSFGTSVVFKGSANRFENAAWNNLGVKRTASGGAWICFYPSNQETYFWDVGAGGVSSNSTNFSFEYQGNGVKAYLTPSGTFSTVGDQVISSDINLKTNLQDVTYSVEDIAKTRAVTFDWKDGRGKSAGSIAQDWKHLIPELVHGEEGHMTLAYGQIAMLNTILLARRSEDHETRIKALEFENAELRKEIERLRS